MKRSQKTSCITILLLVLLLGASCNKGTVQRPSPDASQPSAKRYHLKGKVVSVDKQAKMVNVDSEAIPGFMDAMTMPYQVKPESELDKLSPGDAVTADVVVQDEKAWLENIAVGGHSDAPALK
jgi:protein SCO1